MTYIRNKIGLAPPTMDPIDALDYPALLDDSAWVIWIGRGRWPDADRLVRYISKSQRDPMKGFYLLTPQHRDAKRFDRFDDAQAWLAEQDKMRPIPWVGLNITTVEQLKLAMGYYVEID